jgi:hypothetical protein
MESMKLLLVALTAISLASAADLKLGTPLAAGTPIALATLLSHSEAYAGKTVQVKGKIAAVCQEMGCWMDLVNDAGQKIRIKVNDGEIEFPKDSAGKTAIAEGKFTKVVLTRDEAVEQAKESAKESGKKFDPASIKSGASYYQIQGTGAVILGN